MATSRDIQEVITKLSSDKAKTRDEGIKLLNSWLEGERSIGFCKLLAKNTARIGPDEIPHAETWPFLVTLLTKCVGMEISGSKKRVPKLSLAKTLRTAIQCAEDPKFGGKTLPLFSVIKQIFNHIWDVIKDVPSFQSEYSSILRLLLLVKEYRYQMKKRVYCGLVVLFMKKVVMAISMKSSAQFSSKEEIFRCILTFHVLLENPPGDFPDNIRDELVAGFVEMFSNIRDEGKISRKLLECINSYLIKDGPNLGSQALEIHCSVQDFMLRCWLTTHDRGLKNSFVFYARAQMKLSRSLPEENPLIEQLLDVVAKELDQGSFGSTITLWSDASRDEKGGSLGSTSQGLMELAAALFYQACTNGTRVSLQEKRLRMETVAVRIKDALMKGSWLWNGAFYYLLHNFGNRIGKHLLIDWFEVACQSLQRILNHLTSENSYDALLWLLRAFQELSRLLEEASKCSSLTSNEVTQIRNNWNVLWTCLLHGLPIFSNVTPVVDVALTLLSDMILREQVGAAVAPQDMWDLMIFKQKPSVSVLYFVSCYFSKKSIQGDVRDALHIRRNLLRATLGLVNFKEPICCNEHVVMLIPAAALSLCTGCVPILPYLGGKSVLPAGSEEQIAFMAEHDNHELLAEIIECSVEALSDMQNGDSIKVKSEQHHSIRLPRQVRQPLMQEMEDFIISFVSSEEAVTKLILSDLINICSLLCNWIYSSVFARLSEKRPAHVMRMLHFVSKLLALIVCNIEEKCTEIQVCGSAGLCSVFEASGSALPAFQCLMSCPLFSLSKERNYIDREPFEVVIQSIDNILTVLGKLFSIISDGTSNSQSGICTQRFPLSPSLQEFSPMDESKAQIIDMDLDIDDGSKDTDTLNANGTNLITSFSTSQWKLKFVLMISTFFPVSPVLSWQTLFDIYEKENDNKVSEVILYILCKNFCGSAESFSALVSLIISTMEKNAGTKLYCVHILSAIHALLETLLSISSRSKVVGGIQRAGRLVSEERLSSLGDLVIEVAEAGLADWFGRIKLIDCICSFVSLEPCLAQAMIGRLLAMLQDTDYRVRLFLAKKVGVLFQTWDGHDELFHDICSNFGFDMVRTSNGKLTKAKDVLACGFPSILAMETALITLAHLALYSEEIEIEAVFMMCVVASMDPCQRKLAYALLDNLSRQLMYSSRLKYLDELIGSILGRWVACEVSLLALVEVQDLFINNSEQKLFMLHCCPWLLPPLVLKRDMQNLDWISKATCKSLSLLIKEFFAPVFAVCFAVHCAKPGKESGATALHSSILRIAEISELERDELIKKNMVSIVSFLLSLTSSSADPAMPYFTKGTVVRSVQTIVDGFF